MSPVFHDPKLEAQFQREGYVKCPFISQNEVAELKQIFFDTLPESGGQITSADLGEENSKHLISYDFTFIDKNPEYKRRVFEVITRYFEPHMDSILANYRPVIANFIRKKPETGEVPLHQNWAFADEKKCSTVSIWCPLVDSTIENGTLQVVPGSHKRFGEIRGPMVPWELDGIKNEIIQKHLVPLETKAGDCVILDDSIVHYSAINKTKDLRLAIQLICIPREMPSLHYHKNPMNNDNKIEILEVDEAFYIHFNPWKFPADVKKVGTLKHETVAIDEKMFSETLYGQRFDEKISHSALNGGFLKKLKRVFGG